MDEGEAGVNELLRWLEEKNGTEGSEDRRILTNMVCGFDDRDHLDDE